MVLLVAWINLRDRASSNRQLWEPLQRLPIDLATSALMEPGAKKDEVKRVMTVERARFVVPPCLH